MGNAAKNRLNRFNASVTQSYGAALIIISLIIIP